MPFQDKKKAVLLELKSSLSLSANGISNQADAKVQGGHALKTTAAYEKWMAAGGEDGVRQKGNFLSGEHPGRCDATLLRQALECFTDLLDYRCIMKYRETVKPNMLTTRR